MFPDNKKALLHAKKARVVHSFHLYSREKEDMIRFTKEEAKRKEPSKNDSFSMEHFTYSVRPQVAQ